MAFSPIKWGRPAGRFGKTAALVGCLAQACAPPPAPTSANETTVSCSTGCQLQGSLELLLALLEQEDTDHDRRITVLDEGPGHFTVPLEGGGHDDIEGTYHLANLVQELYLLRGEPGVIPLDRVREPIASRISRVIGERYWEGLTRKINDESLDIVLADPKMDEKKDTRIASWPIGCSPAPAEKAQFLYVPHDDEEALSHYSSLRASHPALVVCQLPQTITPEWVRSLDPHDNHGSRHGLLSLALTRNEEGELEPLPYGVPGGRFNEMYGWDTYFHVRGLLSDHKTELARALVENQLYEVAHYGKVLNANRTYYLTRSQPPFLSSAVRAIWQQIQPETEWLRSALVVLENEYQRVWTGSARRTPLCRELPQRQGSAKTGETLCLSAYHASGIGEPPEVEPGHFDWLYEAKAKDTNLAPATYRKRYLRRDLPQEQLSELDTFFLHDRSMRESGHDTTYRWTTEEGDQCANFATVDLNALLFKYEIDLATLTKEAGKADWQKWCDRASVRRELIQKYLYDGKLFVDAEMERNQKGELRSEAKKSSYISATTLFPLWASQESPCTRPDGSDLTLFSSRDQVERLVKEALKNLEAPGGISATARSSVESAPRASTRQWDFPFGWAPHQILAWEGLRQHGFDEEANRLTYRWLFTIAKNAHDYHGTVPEKYDVVNRSHLVFAEYGNVGTDFSYITEEGFGWMNASFQLGLSSLNRKLQQKLNQLVPPEQLSWPTLRERDATEVIPLSH